jgi:hypothetical protein
MPGVRTSSRDTVAGVVAQGSALVRQAKPGRYEDALDIERFSAALRVRILHGRRTTGRNRVLHPASSDRRGEAYTGSAWAVRLSPVRALFAEPTLSGQRKAWPPGQSGRDGGSAGVDEQGTCAMGCPGT